MKKTLKSIITIAVVASLVLTIFSGCSKSQNANFDVVLITTGEAVNDGKYNEYAWNGIKSYCEENDMTCRYYQPSYDKYGKVTVETVSNYVDIASKNGAKYVVLLGEDFASTAYEVAPTYSSVNFILVDAFPHAENETAIRPQQNVMSVSFDALQAGFLAGYTTVYGQKDSDGNYNHNTKIGYFGSVKSLNSGNYGAGFVQGAQFAADELSLPVVMDYANYDAANLNYSYSVTVEPEYQKISECQDETFNVKVVDGLGTGTYADGDNVTITANPNTDGKVFDHWEVKSDTKGVKDKKVNISSSKKSSMNLQVGSCDCTITAIYRDEDTVKVSIYDSEGEVSETLYAPVNSSIDIKSAAAPAGMTFDSWVVEDENMLKDVNSSYTQLTVADKDVVLKSNYVETDIPSFIINVKNGTGSGRYVTDDQINISAEAPKEGYMFKEWKNVDFDGNKAGLSFDDEYAYATSVTVNDRLSSLVERMFNQGDTVVFGGGNKQNYSIYTATWQMDKYVCAYGCGYDQGSEGNTLYSVVTDYGNAIKLCLSDYKGGSILAGTCENGCIYVNGLSSEETYTNDDGETVNDDNYDEHYAAVYNALKTNSILMISVQSGGDVRKIVNSKCFSLDYWVVD